MKRTYISLLLFLLISFYSCDKELIEDFTITNTCRFDIRIQAANMNGLVIDTVILAGKDNCIFYTNTGYGNSVYEINLANLFEYFKVSCDDSISNINYLNNSLWEYKELSDTHSEYSLEIDSTHFQ